MADNKLTLSPQKERNFWFDNAKAFLIICVFIGHISECLIKNVPFENGTPLWINSIYKFVYVFHMPVFMIISGRFAKNRINCNDWHTTINKLIVPYIAIQIFMMLFYSVTGYADVTLKSSLKPGYGLWYILVLGIYQLVTPYILKIFRHKWIILPLSLVIMFVYLYVAPYMPPPIPRIINFFPFFIFGYLTSDYKFDLIKKVPFKLLSVSFFVLLFVLITKDSVLEVALLTTKRVYNEYNELLDINQFELFIITIVRYLVGFVSFFFVMGICTEKKNIFTKIGTQSTYIYILHLFVIIGLIAFDRKYNILDFCANEFFAVIMILSAIPVSFIFVSSFVRKCTGWLITPKFDLIKFLRKTVK